MVKNKNIANLYNRLKEKKTNNSTDNGDKPTEEKDNVDDATSSFVDNNGETNIQLTTTVKYSHPKSERRALRDALNITQKQTDKLHKFLSTIETSSQRLLLLLNDLLDLSKLESGKDEFELKNHDLYQLSQQIAEEFSAKIEEKQLEFILKKPINFCIELFHFRVNQYTI